MSYRDHEKMSGIHRTMHALGVVLLMLCAQACYDSAPQDESDTSTDTDSDSDTDSNDTDTVDTETEIEWLYFEDFDTYEVGDLISELDEDNWEVWPGAEDAPVSNEQSNSSPNSLRISNEGDVILLMGYDSGKYNIKFDIFVDENMMAYYNFQSILMGYSPYPLYFEVFFYAGGVGNLQVYEDIYSFEYDDSEWVVCSHLIDLDEDVAILKINGETILKWQYSLPQGGNGNSTIDYIDFYGVTDPPGSRYWVDNIGVEIID